MKTAVTGAFGYSGKYIAEKLLANGHSVITLTNSVQRANEFDGRVKAFPYNFDNLAALTKSLADIDVLYNTYWVRFNHPLFNHADAVANTLVLFEAARQAGVKRIVHISITNPSETSRLEYFSGKAKLEKGLFESGIPYSILRPTVIFGREDILINNIAWVLRHLPVFGVFGDGEYKLQPIYVEDLADLAVKCGESQTNEIIDAIGPETFSYRGLVEAIGKLIGVKRAVISVSPEFGFLAGQIIGALTNDVIITRPEIEGLMANLLYTDSAPTRHSDTLGKSYTSELKRRIDRSAKYSKN
ncbi:MAG: NAD-dependent epimerase/dehydratase family protein [Chloroflexi bacterium]|nr:NAD-dependent epimerase/dehydratase family protein [Chloroflexota bacterium]